MSMRNLETTVTGWVANQPEVRKLNSGRIVTTFRLIHTPRYKTDSGWVDGRSSTFKVTAWGILGDNVQASVRQGNPVIVSGRLEIDTWDGKEGKRSEAVINANSIGFDLALSRSLCYRPSKKECLFNTPVYLEAIGQMKSPVITYNGATAATPYLSDAQLREYSQGLPALLERARRLQEEDEAGADGDSTAESDSFGSDGTAGSGSYGVTESDSFGGEDALSPEAALGVPHYSTTNEGDDALASEAA